MPIQYAVQESVPEIPAGPGSVAYHIVPLEVAETHEYGCYALFNDDGEQVSPWCILVQKGLDNIRPDKRESAKDRVMQTITVGDYVAYSDGGNSPMSIGKVIGFTNKQVRILPMSMYPHSSGRLMYESSVIRLPEPFWHGTV